MNEVYRDAQSGELAVNRGCTNCEFPSKVRTTPTSYRQTTNHKRQLSTSLRCIACMHADTALIQVASSPCVFARPLYLRTMRMRMPSTILILLIKATGPRTIVSSRRSLYGAFLAPAISAFLARRSRPPRNRPLQYRQRGSQPP